MGGRILLILGSVLFAALAPPRGSATEGPVVTVLAPDPALAAQIETEVATALALLAECGLEQRAALTVAVVDEVVHPLGPCLSCYSAERERVEVLDPALFETRLGQDDPYRLLPADALLASLLRHELVHALLAQGGVAVTPVDQEYVANALELEGLAPEFRERLLAARPVARPGPGLISLGVYALAPRAFANNAWLHFSAPGNGCALVARLVAGETSFAGR